MISSTTLSIPRDRHGSTHSVNTAGLAGGPGGGAGGGRRSGSYDWSTYAYPPTPNVYVYGQQASRSSSQEPPEPYDLEKFLLLRYSPCHHRQTVSGTD